MRYYLLITLLFLSLVVSAQQTLIAPKQIRPGTNGQVLTTSGGVVTWSLPSGGGETSPWIVSGANVYRASGSIGIGTSDFSGTLNTLTAASSNTRERILKSKVSDAINSEFGVANGTSGNGAFIPTFYGSNMTDNNIAFIFRAITATSFQASGSNPLYMFDTFQANDNQDPNGTIFSGQLGRDIAHWRNGGTIALKFHGNGDISHGTARVNYANAVNGDVLKFDGTNWNPTAIAGDNLGDHTAIQDLIMGGNSIRRAAASTFRIDFNTSDITLWGGLGTSWRFDQQKLEMPLTTATINQENTLYMRQFQERGKERFRLSTRMSDDYTIGNPGLLPSSTTDLVTTRDVAIPYSVVKQTTTTRTTGSLSADPELQINTLAVGIYEVEGSVLYSSANTSETLGISFFVTNEQTNRSGFIPQGSQAAVLQDWDTSLNYYPISTANAVHEYRFRGRLKITSANGSFRITWGGANLAALSVLDGSYLRITQVLPDR